MEHDKQLLIDIVSEFLVKETTLQPNESGMLSDEPKDPDAFFHLANEHCLDSVVYACRKAQINRSRNSALYSNAFQRDVFYYVNRRDILREISEEFSKKKIPFVCMKGIVFSAFYPIPELRSMGDIDIVIHPEDKETVDHILCDILGYSRFVNNHAVWNYYQGIPYRLEVEVHYHMFYEELANHFDYRSYFDHIWEHCHNEEVCGIQSDYLYVPDKEFHFLYLMTHTAKHIINNGSGFRAYADMALMARNCDLDWEWVGKELEKLELLDFTRTCFTLCELWFQVKMPLGGRSLDGSFFDIVTEKTFQDGVFGLENRQNAGAQTAKEIKRGKKGYLSSALKLNIRRLFPSYENLRLIPWYSFVNERPWLVPAAWVYRFFYCLIRKRKHSEELFLEPFNKKKIVKQRQSYLQQWGL